MFCPPSAGRLFDTSLQYPETQRPTPHRLTTTGPTGYSRWISLLSIHTPHCSLQKATHLPFVPAYCRLLTSSSPNSREGSTGLSLLAASIRWSSQQDPFVFFWRTTRSEQPSSKVLTPGHLQYLSRCGSSYPSRAMKWQSTALAPYRSALDPRLSTANYVK